MFETRRCCRAAIGWMVAGCLLLSTNIFAGEDASSSLEPDAVVTLDEIQLDGPTAPPGVQGETVAAPPNPAPEKPSTRLSLRPPEPANPVTEKVEPPQTQTPDIGEPESSIPTVEANAPEQGAPEPKSAAQPPTADKPQPEPLLDSLLEKDAPLSEPTNRVTVRRGNDSEPAAANAQPPVKKNVVTFSGPPSGWISDFAAPVRIDVTSPGGGELKTSLAGGGWRIARTTTLAPGQHVVLEQTMFGGRGGSFVWALDGDGEEKSLSWSRGGARRSAGESPAIICLDGYLYRELRLLVESSGEASAAAVTLSARDLPSQWQSYLGLRAVMLAESVDIARLAPAQRAAMVLWIRWLGGTLWLSGAGAERVLERMGLPLSSASVREGEHFREASFCNGKVFVLHDPDPAPVFFQNEMQGNPFSAYFEAKRYGFDEGAKLLEKLGEIPVEFIVGALVLLGLLLGPVLCLYVFRKGKPLLLFLLTPIVALCGTVAIVGGAFLMEGIGVQYNQVAVLARHAGGNNAMLFDLRGVRPGFSPPPLHFSGETLLLPVPGATRPDDAMLDVTNGIVPGPGWLRPRFASGYLAARPLVCRMNVEVHPDGTGYKVVNNLGHGIIRMAAMLPDGNLVWAENVAAGEAKPLEWERGTRRYEALCESVAAAFDKKAPFPGIHVVAEAEGLPYLDDGGLGGRLRDGRFYYVVAGNRELHGAAEVQKGDADE